MNLDEYITNLKAKNSYCNCKDIQELFEQKKKAESLEGRCAFFKRNADLNNPKQNDLNFLKDYREAVEQFQQSVTEYHKNIARLADEGKITLILHDKSSYSPKRKLTVDETNLLQETNTPLITIHCSSCNQQIDLAGK